MSNDSEMAQRIKTLTHDYSQLAGRFSAISGYLDEVGVPSIPKVYKRVKLLTILYRQLQIENERLTLLLNEMNQP